MTVTTLAFLLFALPVLAIEPDPAGYERILIPIYVTERPGAFGSLWKSELTVRNEGDLPAQVFQSACAFFCTCEVTVGCTSSEAAPHTFVLGSTEPSFLPGNFGAFLYVNRPRAEDLAVQLRLRDVSRQAESWGTEIPVVRDQEMRLGTTHLLDVPVDPAFRVHLRLYGASSPTGTGVLRVRIYPQNGNLLLAARVVTLVQSATSDPRTSRPIPRDDEFPRDPAYAEVASLAGLLPPGTDGPVRVEVTSLTPGLKYWAMISITNNTTQRVTLITPQ